MGFTCFLVCILCFCISSLNCITLQELANKKNVKINHLEQVARINSHIVQANKSDTPKLQIFCYSGESTKRIGRIFTSATFKLGIIEDQYHLYKGHNETDVYQQYESVRQSWFGYLPWRTESVNLDIFNKTCVGVVSQQQYKVKLNIKAIDVWIVSYLIIGLILFFSANRLSKNVVFFYGTGVSLGLVASLLIVVFIMSRFTPKKHYGAYAVMIGGWSIALYLLQKVWENIQLYLEEYLHYVIGYFVLAGFISFAVCYYKGPPTEPRKLNLIKWGIQLISLVLLYNGTQISSVSITIIGLAILKHNFPAAITRAALSYWRRKFPPKIKLLSEEEYIRQGHEETQKALEELKEYCRSPNCDAWKTISRLGTPHKFASWIEGNSHLSEDEFKAYDSTDHSENLPSHLHTDDEDEMDFVLSSP